MADTGYPAPHVAKERNILSSPTYVLVMLTIVNGLSFIDRNVFNVLIETIKREMGVSDAILGFMSGFGFVLLYCLFSLPIGWLADRFNRVRIICSGLAIWSGMTILSGFAANTAQLALARGAVGCAEAANAGPAQSILADIYPPQRRGRAMSVLALGVFAGVTLGFVIGGIVNASLGWRWAFFVAGAPGLIVALLIVLTVKEPIRGVQDRGGPIGKSMALRAGLAFLGGQRSYILVTLGFCLASLCNAAMAAWTVPAMIRVHGMAEAVAGPMVGLAIGASGFAGATIGAIMMPHLARRDMAWMVRAPAIALLLAVPCLLLFCFGSSVAAVFAGVIAGTVLAGFQIGPLIASLQTVCRADVRAFGGSLANVMTNLLGWGTGPFLVGILNDLWTPRLGAETLRYTMLVGPAASLSGALILLFAVAHFRRDVEKV